jgi:hypothetical protein
MRCVFRERVFSEQCVSSGHPLSILDNNSELLDSRIIYPRLALWHSAKRTTMASGWIELWESTFMVLRALVFLSAALLSVLDLLGFRFGVLTARWAWRIQSYFATLQIFGLAPRHSASLTCQFIGFKVNWCMGFEHLQPWDGEIISIGIQLSSQ